eukprot:13222235-Alexandrium_andersonii.AAC.1
MAAAITHSGVAASPLAKECVAATRTVCVHPAARMACRNAPRSAAPASTTKTGWLPAPRSPSAA